jgi:hypothetical protein
MELLKSTIDRRIFIRNRGVGAGLLIATTGLPLSSYGEDRGVRLGFVAVGGRGVHMLRTALNLKGMEVVAVCDIVEEKVARAQRIVEEAGQEKPQETDWKTTYL